MHLYEVVHWGSHGNGDAEDTIYLVRATHYREAVDLVFSNASPSDHNGVHNPISHTVYEIGTDSSSLTDHTPVILRGPYFAYAHNHGWKSWSRVFGSDGYLDQWELDSHADPDSS